MKKFLKILSITLASIIGVLYIVFLIVPPFIKLDGFKDEIKNQVKTLSKLNLDYSKARLYSTPLLSVGVIIENLNIKFDDNTTLLSTPKIKAGISLPHLLTYQVRASKCYIDNPEINLEIVNSEQYKVVKLIENIINENNKNKKTALTQQEIEANISTNQPNEEIESIVEKLTYKVPSIKITDYSVNVNDLKAKHSLILKGEKLILGYDSKENYAKLKTDSHLLSDNKENIHALINIKADLPEFEKQKDEFEDNEEVVKLPFINIVEIYQTYDLNAFLDTKLRIKHTDKKGYIVRGHFNVDDLNLKLSDIRLPNSYLHSKFRGRKIIFESDIFAKEDEKISLKGMAKYGKHPKLKTEIISDKISFSNLLDLSEALLESLNVNNTLNQIKASGYLCANAKIDTNFKKLKSEGQIVVKDGSFINPNSNYADIEKINADLVFDNNALNINNANMLINKSKLNLTGSIDKEANADINLNVDKLKLNALYNSFAPKEIKKQLLLNSADLTALVNIKGKLNNLNAFVDTKLDNLSLSDSKKTVFVNNDEVGIKLNADMENIQGQIKNKDFTFNMPQMNTKVISKSAEIDIDNEKISIKPLELTYNNLAKIDIKGEVLNYLKNPDIDIFVTGVVPTNALKQTLGKELSFYMPSKGAIPFKSSIKGNSKEQNIIAQIYADSNNYISPIELRALRNASTIIQTKVQLKGKKIKIKDAGIFRKDASGFSTDLEVNTQAAKQLVDLKAIIDDNHINLFRLKSLEDIDGKIAIFKKSFFTVKGKVNLYGDLDNFNYKGDLFVHDLNIPEILFGIKDTRVNLNSKTANVNIKDIDLNNSKINVSFSTDLKPAKVTRINNLNIFSNLINVDEALKVTENLNKYMPPVSSSSASSTNSNIPVEAIGKFDIKKIKTGEMIIDNTRGHLLVKNNHLYLHNLLCDAFRGNIKGDIAYNLISGLIGVKLSGKNLDTNTLMTQAAGLKDTLSGNMNFKTDISLKGATYLEQVKSLKGSVYFDMKNGQYGPFAKLENFFLAENVRENPLFKNTIGIILTPIATIDSSHYENLSGRLDFNNGIVDLNQIKSQGNILCILIKGNMDLIKNELNAKVRVRLASSVSDMLGPLSMANPVNLVKNTPGLNDGTAKLFSLFTQIVNENEYKEIPMFSKNHTDSNATKFQIVLKGDVNKPLRLVKSFKWLALQEEYDKAQEFSNNYIKEQEQKAKEALLKKMQEEYEQNNKLKVGIKKVLQMDTTAPDVKQALVNEVLNKIKEKTNTSSL